MVWRELKRVKSNLVHGRITVTSPCNPLFATLQQFAIACYGQRHGEMCSNRWDSLCCNINFHLRFTHMYLWAGRRHIRDTRFQLPPVCRLPRQTQSRQWPHQARLGVSRRLSQTRTIDAVTWWRQTSKWAQHSTLEGGSLLGLGFHLSRHRAVSGPGAVATETEAWKQSKYSSLAATYYFVRVAVETLGALGEKAAQFISDLGRRIAATAAEPRSVVFLFQRLSVAIQQGNAASVTRTWVSSAKLDDIFFISCGPSCVRCGRQWLRHLQTQFMLLICAG